MNNEEENNFIDRTIKHIRMVQDNMIWLEKNIERLEIEQFEFPKWALIQRGMKHDASKFEHTLVEGYVLTNTYFNNKKLGLENNINVETLKLFWKQHQKIEKHHPQFKTQMSDLDICEMCCDLAAISQEKNEKDYTDYFKNKLIKENQYLEKYRNKIIQVLELLQELTNK